MGETTCSTNDGYVSGLCSRLRARLGDLEAETNAIRAALNCLEAPRSMKAASASTREQHALDGDETVIVRALQESPGSRASLLALATDLESADVRSVLERLESSGMVRRDGLGWTLVKQVGHAARRPSLANPA